jgi:hypothetical protein
MEREEAISILTSLIKELEQVKPRGTGIRAENVKGLVVQNCKFIGLDKALDASNSQDIIWERNLVNNYNRYSELPGLLKQFLAEASKKETQANKSILVRIKDQVLNRWPEIVGTSLAVAIICLIGG